MKTRLNMTSTEPGDAMNYRCLVPHTFSVLTFALLTGCGGYDDEPDTNSTAATGTDTSSTSTATSTTDTTTPGTGSTTANTSDSTPSGDATQGAASTTPPEASCDNVTACGGDVVGTWAVTSSCVPVSGETDMMGFGLGCTSAPVTGMLNITGTWTLSADGMITDATSTSGAQEIELPPECLDVSGTVTTCDRVGAPLQGLGFASVTCADNDTGGCDCPATIEQSGGAAYVSFSPVATGTYTTADNKVIITNGREETEYTYCVTNDVMTMTPTSVNKTGGLGGTIVLQKQ